MGLVVCVGGAGSRVGEVPVEQGSHQLALQTDLPNIPPFTASFLASLRTAASWIQVLHYTSSSLSLLLSYWEFTDESVLACKKKNRRVSLSSSI